MNAAAGNQPLMSLWRRFESIAIGVLVTLALGIFLYGSLARTLAPALAIDWSEEVTIYLIVWATLICGGSLTADRSHVSAQMIAHFLPPKARRLLQIGVDLLMFVFCGLMFWLGVEGVLFAHALDERSASTLQAPQAWALYLALPVGMSLITVRTAFLLLINQSTDHA